MNLARVVFLGALSTSLVAAVACGTTVTGDTGAGTSGTTTTTSGTGGGQGGQGGTPTTVGTGGSPVDAGPDVDNGMPSTMYPAPHDAPPQVVSFGGAVMSAPNIYPVYFNNDDATFTAQLTTFMGEVVDPSYWGPTTSEYGVGAATALPPIQLLEAAPATLADADIQTWLGAKLNADDPAFLPQPPNNNPADYSNTLFVLYYPASTVISTGGGMGGAQQSCQSFGGYHSNFQLDGNHNSQNVAYAVVPRCSNFDGMSTLDATTGSASHEMVEAATDPFPMAQAPGYAQVDDLHLYWERALGGGETGDMCAQFPNVFAPFPPAINFVVQRTWSNKSAKAGHDPCVPAPAGQVYFNAVPKLDKVMVSAFGQMVNERAVQIPLGMSKTIDVDLFSDGDTGGEWTVTAKDQSAAFGGMPRLTLTLDRDHGVNGEKLHLTITVMVAGKNKTEGFILTSTKGGVENLWFGLVAN